MIFDGILKLAALLKDKVMNRCGDDAVYSMPMAERQVIQQVQALLCQHNVGDVMDHIDPEYLSKSLVSMAMKILYADCGDLENADTSLRRFMFEYWPVVIEDIQTMKFISQNDEYNQEFN